MAYSVSGNTPVDYSWKLSKCGNYLKMDWFEGDQVPPEIESFKEANIRNEDEDSDGNIYESDESDVEDGSDLR